MKQEIAVNVSGTEFGFSLYDLKVITDHLERLYPWATITSFTSSLHSKRGELMIVCRSVNTSDPETIVFTRSDEWLGCFNWTHMGACPGDVP